MTTTALTPTPRQLSIALRTACARIGIDPAMLATVASITPYIKDKFHLSTQVAIDYLRLSANPEARKVLAMVDCRELRAADRKALTLEAYCLAAGVPPMNIIEILGGVLIRLGAQESSVIAAVHHPAVVARTVEQALGGDTKSQSLLYKASGFLPTPKGSTTTIQIGGQQPAAAAPAASVVAPPPEQTIRKLTDRFNESRQQAALPSAPAATEPQEYIEDATESEEADTEAEADEADEE